MRPERQTSTDDEASSRSNVGNMVPLVPVLHEGTAILLGACGLLWVDDGGSRHYDGSTFTWCRLVEYGKKNQNDYNFVFCFFIKGTNDAFFTLLSIKFDCNISY